MRHRTCSGHGTVHFAATDNPSFLIIDGVEREYGLDWKVTVIQQRDLTVFVGFSEREFWDNVGQVNTISAGRPFL